ncbi:unnamed protein product [Leptidea sinapis]|uniref:Tyrosine specific protein phosphatases domain-containing protein n=1 Tax=Leptidea sinapis TaxID=189913 RepID=A0A5E4QB91_9NEOP|nr:unnamed protein product [Leptidea sinapis]
MAKVLSFALQEGRVAIHCHAGLGRTGVLIACYLVYSLRIRANDAIRLVRKKRPTSIQTRGQILCVQQFEHYILPQTIVFSSKEPILLTKDAKSSEFTLKQFLYRQRVTLHGLDERAFRYLPKIVYKICERLLKLCSCHNTAALDYRVTNKPFYTSFICYKLRQQKPPDLTTPEDKIIDGPITSLPMIEWRDPIEEDVEKNLEEVSRYTSSIGCIPAVQVYEEDPGILTGLLFQWLEGLKQPVEVIMLLEYLLRFVIRLRPITAQKKVDILKRLLASLTHQSAQINGVYFPNNASRLREGTSNHMINFMLRMVVEIQKDVVKPCRDDADVVAPSRKLRIIKAWK